MVVLPYLRYRHYQDVRWGASHQGAVIAMPPKGISFEVDHGAFGKWAVVHVAGDLDWTRSAALRVTVERLWESLAGGTLILALASMTFCDSSGISQMITAFRGCQERNIRMALAAPPAFLRRMLTTTGLHQLFEVHDTLEQALASVKGRDSDADTASAPSA
ncbi:STAS domain-containing protein [Microbispora sp. NEAU-D428]|uniref:STAS domain-containing protein n=1 Tax=Microbispora sitophila TaxID=2771537 RepID=UPI001865AD2C|nr:STAS domain-containing protein [Microbispora sitophila]MBE3014029.1 STAS domain-containing protein [Microbispora sitophila]